MIYEILMLFFIALLTLCGVGGVLAWCEGHKQTLDNLLTELVFVVHRARDKRREAAALRFANETYKTRYEVRNR